MKTNLFERPLLIVPAIPKDGGIKFILPDCSLMLGDDVAEKGWEILELCDGINTIDAIIGNLADQDPVFVRGFLEDLRLLNIVIDSRRMYEVFHSISNYPTVYSTDITPEEVDRHSESLRLPVKEGVVYDYHQNTESGIRRLQELRKSCRSYSSRKLRLDEVGNLLDIGYSLKRHAVPSAGGLYPMKIFVIALEDQDDFPAGYYEYDCERDCLVLFNKKPDSQRIFYALNDTSIPFDAPVLFLIAADINRQPYKYSNKGYRFMAIEAGEVAQNISLAAVEMGLSTCQLGGLHEDVFTDELKLESCIPFVAMVAGEESDVDADVSQWRSSNELVQLYVGQNKPVERYWISDESADNNYGKSYFQFFAKTQNDQITSGISTCSSDAKLKAVVEGYERQRSSCVRWDLRSRAVDLPGRWLDPRVVTPLDESQYSKLIYLQKFSEYLDIEWVCGNGADGERVFVPIDLVFYPINTVDRKLIVDTCSSGFAAYTDYDSAVERGLLELIERDCLMRNWYTKSSPRIIETTRLPVHLQNRVDFWKKLGREVLVLDISRSGTIAVEVIIRANEYPCFVSGASCTLRDFSASAIKAFQEAESNLIRGICSVQPKEIEPDGVLSILDHELLYAQSTRYHDQIRYLWSGNVVDTIPVVSTSFEELKSLFDIIVVDVSEPESMLKVVKVLSEKLIPIGFGYNGGHHTHGELENVVDESLAFPHYFA